MGQRWKLRTMKTALLIAAITTSLLGVAAHASAQSVIRVLSSPSWAVS